MTSELARPGWIWPKPLNATYVKAFNEVLEPPEVMTFRPHPACSFGGNGSRPDIIFDSVYNLDYAQRSDRDYPDNDRFGHMDTVVRVGDEIALDWEGSPQRSVGLTCHECKGNWTKDGTNAQYACENFKIPEYEKEIYTYSAALSEYSFTMDLFFTWGYSYPFDIPPRNKFDQNVGLFERNSVFEMPKFSGKTGVALCMFTLDWDPWILNDLHSVPFPVFSGPRSGPGLKIGEYSEYSIWKFSVENPNGAQVRVETRYTPELINAAPSKPSKNATIISAVLGSVAAFVLIVYLYRRYMLERRQKKQLMLVPDAIAAEPFDVQLRVAQRIAAERSARERSMVEETSVEPKTVATGSVQPPPYTAVPPPGTLSLPSYHEATSSGSDQRRSR